MGPLRRITALKIANSFTSHWVFAYGAQRTLLTDDGKQLTAKVFQHVCQILGISNVFRTTYQPQSNGQSERYNRTVQSVLRKYVADHPVDWDLQAESVTFAYNTQQHASARFAPFDLVAARPQTPIAVDGMPPDRDVTTTEVEFKCAERLDRIMRSASEALKKAQERYEKAFDLRMRKQKDRIRVHDYFFLRRNHTCASDGSAHKLAPIADGPYEVRSVTDDTCDIYRGDEIE